MLYFPCRLTQINYLGTAYLLAQVADIFIWRGQQGRNLNEIQSYRVTRPTKQGVDYFPLDVQFDDKIELLITEKGANALSVLVTTWQLIYQNEGYYIKFSDDLFLLIKRRLMLPTDEIKEILLSAIKRSIFDADHYKNHHILTSRAIQKRYFIASKKKKIVNVDENYLCCGVSATGNSVSMGVNAVGKSTNVKEEEEVDVKGKEQGGGVPVGENQQDKIYVQDIPYDEIIKLYHDNAPSLKPCERMTMQLMRDIQVLWNDRTTGLSKLNQWANFFKHCEQSDWLSGRAQSKRRPHLLRELVQPETYAKIYEGAYD